MVKKKEKVNNCAYCNTPMDFSKKHALLGTYKGDKALDEQFFHFACFVAWHEEKTKEKAQNIVNNMQKKVVKGVVPIMKNVLSGIKDLDLGENINFQTNLDLDNLEQFEKDIIEGDKPKKKEKKKNGRNKKR